MVSHYLTIKLIGREHIPHRKTFHTQPCDHVSYPVLITVSGGYPEVRGRLLTCYSPVRRSSTPERAFPLDLHVLSTPPAFVLSQDQTLHRKPNPHTHQKAGTRKKRATSPDVKQTLTKKLPESSSKKPSTTPTTQPQKAAPPEQSTGQNKLIRRLSNTLLSSQESDAPALDTLKGPWSRGNLQKLTGPCSDESNPSASGSGWSRVAPPRADLRARSRCRSRRQEEL